jgi:hypothetical protein
MISLRMLLACFWSLLILAVPSSSRADISLSFMPTEEAKFLFKGEGYEGVATIHLTVDYDSTYLSAPEVTVMGGKLLQGAPPDTPPGRLQLDIQTDEQSPVFEACLFFRKQGDSPAVINFVTAEAIDPGGAQQPLAVVMLPNPNLSQQRPAGSVEGVPSANPELQTAPTVESEE